MLGQLLLAGALILFAGCSSKNENTMEKSFKQVTGVGHKMQKTEKIKISENNEVKVFLTATYLNSEVSAADDDNKVKEKFIIGLYQIDDGNLTGLVNGEQNLTINFPYPESDKTFTRAEEKKRKQGMFLLPTSIKKLSLNDPMLKNIPLVNNWSSYYYVEFPHSEALKFSLVYQNKIYGKIPMPLSNVAKSVNNKAKKKDQNASAETANKTVKQAYRQYKMYFFKNPKYLNGGYKKLF